MLKNGLLIVAATASIIVGAVSVQAQPSPPDQVAPKDHMTQDMQKMMQNMQNMHAQMSKMAESCNKMMEGMMKPSAPPEQKQ